MNCAAELTPAADHQLPSPELRRLMFQQVQHKYLETLLKALGREFDP